MWPFRRRSRRPRTQETPAPPSTSPTPYTPSLPPLSVERRFRDDMPYVLPKDLDEENRLDFQHYALRYVFQGNFLAPLQNPQSILDVGCGTGIWAHEMKEQFPGAKVVGFDMEKPVRQGNYEFVRGNLLQGLPFKDATFDYVHQRLLIGAIPATSWSEVIHDLVRVTRPGGWIELVESDGTGFHPAGPRTQEISQQVIRIAAKRGIDTTITSSLDKLLQQAGLSNVQKRAFPVPVGRWGGRLGNLMLADMTAIERSFKDAFVALLGYQPQQYDRMLEEVIREWEAYKSQYVFYDFIGQKIQ
ncbi:MAG: class I SAM-dependent methyltransferase [Ktedonobacteraceae bacterium]|nr:class I SAM-dependent methyltransferase [Ktedonobacteraceae bacterium]